MLSAFADGRLFGARTGKTVPGVLALHGWRRSHRDFDAVLGVGEVVGGAPVGELAGAAVGGELAAIALDLPGFGATPPPPEAWGSDRYAAAVAPVLAEMDTPAVLLGHSFGGGVALHLAAQCPERVGGVVLTGTPRLLPRDEPPPRPARAFQVVRRLHRLHLVSDARMEAARHRYGSDDYRAADGVMRDVFVRLMTENYQAQLEALSVPVVLVWGETDTAAPLSLARRALDHLADGRLVECPGTGHMTPIEAPEPLRQAVEELRRHVEGLRR